MTYWGNKWNVGRAEWVEDSEIKVKVVFVYPSSTVIVHLVIFLRYSVLLNLLLPLWPVNILKTWKALFRHTVCSQMSAYACFHSEISIVNRQQPCRSYSLHFSPYLYWTACSFISSWWWPTVANVEHYRIADIYGPLQCRLSVIYSRPTHLYVRPLYFELKTSEHWVEGQRSRDRNKHTCGIRCKTIIHCIWSHLHVL